MKIPLLDLKAQYEPIREEIRGAVDRVLDSQNFILGPEVEALEREIAEYSHCSDAVGVSSGTDAILVALMAMGVGEGDEVIIPSYTFFATAGCVARLGAIPVFVDNDRDSFNVNVAQIEAAITDRTKVIMPVHLFGQMAEMDAIMDLASSRDIAVLEDSAQAIGSEYHGKRSGSIGAAGCFSFFPSKNLGGVGDGGMVTTNDPALAERMRLLRSHGAKPKYHHKIVGANFRLDAIQAAVLRVKLRYLDSWTEGRRRNADLYRRLFAEQDAERQIVLPVELPDRRHIYNQFLIRVQRRDEVLAALKARGIGSEIYYPIPLHLQECFAGLSTRALPESELAANETMALPIYPELTEEMLKTVVTTLCDLVADPVARA